MTFDEWFEANIYKYGQADYEKNAYEEVARAAWNAALARPEDAKGPAKTCGNCRFRGEPIEHEWWDEAKDDTVTRQTYFLCDLIKHINGEYGEKNYVPGLGAGVKDGSGYHAALCVESDFACNRWQERVPQQQEDK